MSANMSPAAGAFVPYTKSALTYAKPQYIKPWGDPTGSSNFLLGSSHQLQILSKEVLAELPGENRPKKGGDIGFFNQGILTGSIMFLSFALSCTGIFGYYAVKFAQSRLR
jgi:hypothetical protein